MRKVQSVRFAIVTMILWSGPSFSQTTEVYLPNTILGGTVLSIPHRGHLSIDGPTYAKIDDELGQNLREDFIRDMILNTDPMTLRQRYGGKERPTTLRTIQVYSMLKLARAPKKQATALP